MKRIGLIFLAVLLMMNVSMAEEHGTEEIPVYVTADLLNLRSMPSRRGIILADREHSESMIATGRWSRDKKWIEVLDPEFGYVWCAYNYVTERKTAFTVETLWDTPIRIRKSAFNGRVTGYLRKGQTIRITQSVLGWGKCNAGWIDLEYCIEIEE